MIDKDTLLFGSFAKQAGSTGCKFFNDAFKIHNVNAIYKSFSVDSIIPAMTAMKTLRIKGAGITMPYKREVLKYVDSVSEHVDRIGAANTIINYNGRLHAENTDWLSVRDMLKEKGIPFTRSFDKNLAWPTYRRVGMQHAAYKILVGEDRQIIGAHILSDKASGITNTIRLAMLNRITVDTLYHQSVMSPYPTRESDLLYMLKSFV